MIPGYTKTKSFWSGLVFFILVIACNNGQVFNEITVEWDMHKPIGIQIPLSILSRDFTEKEIPFMRIRLDGNIASVLGEYQVQKNVLVFNPIVPFTPGLQYQVHFKDKLIGKILIPQATTPEPVITAVYPIQDTLPENLLKFYIRFSNPMQTGEIMQYIKLIKNKTDTLSDTFMDLQNELWNEDHTQLTLWLNPGRIKRGLQPNLAEGPPLLKGNQYQLIITSGWQDTQGKKLGTSFIKTFHTTDRDTISPGIGKMNSILVYCDSNRQEVNVHFSEPLDHELLYHTISIVDAADNDISERFQPNEEGTAILFKMKRTKPGKLYRLKAEARQEDLCGNNLNRLFDMDKNKPSNNQKVFYKNLELNCN